MALSLIVENGSGLSTANTLLSLADAETYYERIPPTWLHAAAWALASNGLKNQVLVRAADYFKNSIQWKGTKAVAAGRLPFPRINLRDPDGFLLSSLEVPEFAAYGQAELAGYMLVADRTAENLAKGIKSLEVEGAVKIQFDKFDRTGVLPDSVLDIISFYGSPVSTSPVKTLVRT